MFGERRKKKNPRGLFERPSGSGIWWINYHDEQGNQRREKVGRKSDALALYQSRKTAIRAGEKLPELKRTAKVMVADLVDLALDVVKNHKDLRNYESKAEIVKASPLGSLPADKLTPHELRTWLEGHCKAPATFNRYKAFFSLCYRTGIEARKVKSNPARDFRQKKEPEGRLRFLSYDEYDELRKVIVEKWVDHLEDFVVSVQSGMRLTEQFTVELSQLDRNRALIRLNDTKNGSKRDVYLNAEALEAIENLLKRRPRLKPKDRLFECAYEDFEQRSWFAPACEEAGISPDEYTWHNNRHTFCSWIAMSGGTLKDIQELAGHKSIQMSARYAHLSGDHKRKVVESLSRNQQHAPKHALGL